MRPPPLVSPPSTCGSCSDSRLLLSLLLLTSLAGPLVGAPSLPGALSTANSSTKAISKRDYFGIPIRMESAPREAPPPPERPFWLPKSPPSGVRFTKDLSRRAWNLLEQRNRPNAVEARRRHHDGASVNSKDTDPLGLPAMSEKRFDPPPLLPEQLLDRLGAHNYDPAFTRVTMPHEARQNPHGSVEFGHHRNVPKSVRGVVRRFAHLLYDGRKGARLDRRTRRNLRKFLAFYTACPVKYQWQDYGPRFWPRWVKTGRCLETERSCSIPPGMHCRPQRHKSVSLLR